MHNEALSLYCTAPNNDGKLLAEFSQLCSNSNPTILEFFQEQMIHLLLRLLEVTLSSLLSSDYVSKTGSMWYH